MMWDLPIAVEISGKSHPIRNKCDYRVVLDVICALNDNELTDEEKIKCALFIFYEDISSIDDFDTAIKEMFRIINGGEEEEQTLENKPKLMDWEHDFSILAPQINKVLKVEIRNPNAYFHWFTVLGGYYGVDPENNIWANVVGIRSKLAKGKKLEKWEQEFYREHRKMVELPRKLTAEEEEFLNSDW